MLSGADLGVYRWNPAAARWNHVPSPMDGLHILQMAQAPDDADIVFAGTRPAEIFRSLDGGLTWQRCRLGDRTECRFVNTPWITSIQFDPVDPRTVWASIEIEGIFRTADLGETWERLNKGLISVDTHNMVFFDAAAGGREILCSTEEGLHKSSDNAANWRHIEAPQAPFVYRRCMARRADGSEIVFLSAGDRPSGETGMLLSSRDRGESWELVDLPGHVNSTIWWIGANAADPGLIFCCTIMGQIWRSTDGGEIWRKMCRELGELRMIAWQLDVSGR